MVEQWRDVVGYEGFYEVSNHGRVRTVERVAVRKNGRPYPVRSRIRAPRKLAKGHLGVTLIQDTEPRSFTIHKLVLEAFVGPAPAGLLCRHLNGNPADNRLENLAWGTGSENQYDAVSHGCHYLSAKTHCVRGHLLESPNLATGPRRICLACKREHDNAKDEGRPFDPERADARYMDVLSGRRRHKSERRF